MLNTELSGLEALQAQIPGPVSKHGRYTPPEHVAQISYDGTCLTRFLMKAKADPFSYRKFLRMNRVGDPFDLKPGTAVKIPTS